jgi:hypothetical protein
VLLQGAPERDGEPFERWSTFGVSTLAGVGYAWPIGLHRVGRVGLDGTAQLFPSRSPGPSFASFFGLFFGLDSY